MQAHKQKKHSKKDAISHLFLILKQSVYQGRMESCIIVSMRNGFGWFILLFIFFGGFFDLLGAFLPIIVLGFMFPWFFQKIFSRRNNFSRQHIQNETVRTMSNREKIQVDNKLRTYFRDHYSLPVYGDVVLTTKSGRYTAVEDLVLAFREEKILSMDEFKSYYPDMYQRIVKLLTSFSQTSEEIMAAEIKKPEVKPEDILSDAQKYIDKINLLNNGIPNEEISKGLDQTCTYLKKIDVAEKKNKEHKLAKLYDYYLPILINILENYAQLKQVDENAKEFKESEVQLIKTIILINEALKTINEQLHEEDYMNLSADITTLQSLLKKDGLVNENPFGKE